MSECNRCPGVTCVNEGFRLNGYGGYVEGRIATVDMRDGEQAIVDIPFDTISKCGVNIGYQEPQLKAHELRLEAARQKEVVIWESQ